MVEPKPIPSPSRVWSEAEWMQIQAGHKSADMDDKWNAFVEGNRLYLHRSWTGLGVYEAEFKQGQDGWVICAAVVTTDRSYRRENDDYESLLLAHLIAAVLLGQWDDDLWSRVEAARG